MLVALIALVAFDAMQKVEPDSVGVRQLPARSLQQQIVPKPTGRNGYEDYLAAADILNSSRHAAFVKWESYHYQHRNGGLADAKSREDFPFVEPPTGLSLDSTPLQVKREYVKQFASVVPLIIAGNLKPVADPRETLDMSTLFPEYSRFKDITKLIVKLAYVNFADGNSAAGAVTLLEGLKMSSKIRRVGPLISNLVGLAQQAIVLAELERNLGQLSLRDTQKLLAFVDRELETSDAMLTSLDFELNFFKSSAQSLDQTQDEYLGDDDLFSQELKRLSPKERQRVFEITAGRLAQYVERVKKLIQSGDSNWMTFDDPIEKLEFNSDGPFNTTDDFVNGLLVNLSPSYGMVLPASARAKTQLRLLRMHALIIKYRWENEKLPAKLADAVPKAELVDPFSNAAFVYEREGNFGYRLFSKGFKDTGPIELRYRRAMPLQDDDEGPRPPR